MPVPSISSDPPGHRLRSQPDPGAPPRPEHGVAPEGVQLLPGTRGPPHPPEQPGAQNICFKVYLPVISLNRPPVHQLPLRALHLRRAGHPWSPRLEDELPVLRNPRLGLRLPLDQLLPQELQHCIDEVKGAIQHT